MNKFYTVFFMALSITFIGTTLFDPIPFSWILKISPLAALVTISLPLIQTTKHKLFIAGLMCSSFGDIFLDINRSQFFIYGLGSFLTAHIFYMVSFTPLDNVFSSSNPQSKSELFAILVYSIFGLVMFSYIQPGLGNLFLPVLIYMSVLMLMGIFTLLSKKSNLWLILGGMSFIVSDSIIGIDKFYSPIPHAGILIMVSYYFAQFSLVKGMFFVTRDSN